jgi:protein involved in polysaccharide export with SLBB domain
MSQPPEIDRAYTLGAEDVLEVGVNQQPGISGQYRVRADGMISMPRMGDIRASGLTTSQLQAVIADRLEANGIIGNPSVTVVVVAVGRPKR